MKKIVSLVLVAVLMVLALASCSNVSESYAEKVNKAAKDGDHYTYSKVIEDLGDDVADLTVDVIVVGRNGVIISVKGCDSMEDIQEKLDDGDTVQGIIVTIAAGKAIAAAYREITKDDLKLG